MQVVTGFKYLGTQIHASYQDSRLASYEVMNEGMTTKCNRVYASGVELFQRQQLIKGVAIPSDYHILYLLCRPCKEARKRLGEEIVKQVWTKKVDGRDKRDRDWLQKIGQRL
jgi:hypothetical protein